LRIPKFHMCGILAILGLREGSQSFRSTALELSKLLRHRGPDWSGVYAGKNNILAHERLAIVDLLSGSQPLFSSDQKVILAVNGEIYNHMDLRRSLSPDTKFRSNSDCEPILHLYEQQGSQFLKELRGMYAFVLVDEKDGSFLAARDPMGIIPLYYGFGPDGSMWFASEMKALVNHCKVLDVFPPGHFYDSKNKTFQRFYRPNWWDFEHVYPDACLDLSALRGALEESVEAHMMSDVPYGVLLSGGLDSSLIASIAQKVAKKKGLSQIHSFAIGLEGSPDLKAAAEVANFIGSRHFNFHFTIQDGLDALNDVIYHLETYDVTTVRASTPMYLMARMIKASGVKMVLSGEGADEIFGGYLYFHKAPDSVEFFQETVRKVQNLHLYDCLRANKSMLAWGVETRVPYLDSRFMDVAMNIDAKHKMTRDEASGQKRMEKYILRKAFDPSSFERSEGDQEETDAYLPESVLWRQKEQFSDGVGYSWIDSLKAHAERVVTDAMFASAKFRFPINTPLTKEAYLYRSIFESHFPTESAVKTVPWGPSVACSTPTAIKWDQSFAQNADPSGRAVADVHLVGESK